VTRLAVALAYADDGLPVVSLHSIDTDRRCSCRRVDCASPGKHPRTRHGLRDATTDAETVAKWWTWWPAANIGICTGTPDGIVVVDTDSEDAELHLRKIAGGDPGGLIVATGRGLHHWYLTPESARIASSAGRLGHGIDVKGVDGYVACPPSDHISGRQYAFVGGMLGSAPAWLLTATGAAAALPPRTPGAVPLPDLHVETTRYGRGVLECRCAAVLGAAEGERNFTLLRSATTSAGYAAAGEINLDEARQLLTAAALERGLGEREIAATIASGFSRGLAAPLHRPPSIVDRVLDARSDAQAEAVIRDA
jgi:hypothetical protein